jgi:hypothetical protein
VNAPILRSNLSTIVPAGAAATGSGVAARHTGFLRASAVII